ncbi:hypothetical protein MANI_117229 [Metarhizium anisopliae]
MPYTPPSHRSPASSGSTSPDVSRRSSFQSGPRPSLPQSASRLRKPRRRPPVSVVSDGSEGMVTPQGPSNELKGMVSTGRGEKADKALRDTGSQTPMVPTKSGDPVRSALRTSSRQLPLKAVHFDSLEHVRHFLQVDRPLAVSAGSSPIDSYEWDTEYPFPGNGRQNVPTPPFEWEILTSNFPPDSAARKSSPVRLDKVWLSNDEKTLLGSVFVADLARQKAVACRFTFDNWKTASEVAADYTYDIRPRETPPGHERFTFSIKLADTTDLESKTLFLCVRYTANGQEYWDNNYNCHFQVDFRKKHNPNNPPTWSQPLDRSDTLGKPLAADTTRDDADHLETITAGSDSSSKESLTEPSSATWSDEAGITEPSSLSYGTPVDREHTIDTQRLTKFYNYTKPEVDKDLQDDDIQSIASIADDIGSLVESTSTMPDHREAAINYLVKKFTDDPELLSLYRNGNKCIDEARFVRNHRRLLKRYFLDQQSEGHMPSEKLAVRFLRVRSDRTRISSEIYRVAKSSESDNVVREKVNIMLDQEKDNLLMLERYLGQQDSTAGAERDIEGRATEDVDVTSEASDDSDAGEPEADMNGRLLKLDATAEFLVAGRPFSLYKQRLREFLQPEAHDPEEMPQLDLAPTGSSGLGNSSRDVDKRWLESVDPRPSNTDGSEPREQPLSSERPLVVASAEVIQQEKDVPESAEPRVEGIDTDVAYHRRIDSAERRVLRPETEKTPQGHLGKSSTPSPQNGTRPTVLSRAVGALDIGIARGYGKILTFLSNIGLREQDVAPGYHQRVRWKNRRGKTLYDDYVEHEPGALQALQDYLQSSAYRSRATPTSDHGHEPSLSSPPASSTNSMQANTSKSCDIADQARTTLVGSTRTSRFREDIEMGERSTNTLHLLSCMERGRYGNDLRPELVTNIKDDGHLFHTLRKSYHAHRGRLRPYWSLRTVHGIHFMKFLYGGPRYIDVRCHHDICENGKPCNCIPPAHLVRPHGSEYECAPVPSKFSPPIGQRLMMDFFTNPDDIELDSTLVLRQLPKRTCGDLQSPCSEAVEAWGIYYKEDWDWAKIWWILGVGFFPPSLVFGILWGILKQDIQGAFGVASWWMAGAAVVVGITGTRTWTR